MPLNNAVFRAVHFLTAIKKTLVLITYIRSNLPRAPQQVLNNLPKSLIYMRACKSISFVVIIQYKYSRIFKEVFNAYKLPPEGGRSINL